ncbi:MAG: hypothetical protein GXO26_08570 [Crenarchaeota archaeon]|nr:hypothetical protein [Thermoproteota archaeon]
MMLLDLLRYYTIPVLKHKWHMLLTWTFFGIAIIYFGGFSINIALTVLAIFLIISFGLTPMYTIANDYYTRRIELYLALRVRFTTYCLLLMLSTTVIVLFTTLLPMLIFILLIYHTKLLTILYIDIASKIIGLVGSCIVSALIGIVLGLWRPSFSFAGGAGTGIILALCIIPIFTANYVRNDVLLYVPPLTPLFVKNMLLKITTTIAETAVLYYIAHIQYYKFFYKAKPVT